MTKTEKLRIRSLIRRRLRHQISRDALARQMGKGAATIHRWEEDPGIADTYAWSAYADALMRLVQTAPVHSNGRRGRPVSGPAWVQEAP